LERDALAVEPTRPDHQPQEFAKVVVAQPDVGVGDRRTELVEDPDERC
jgi:hypothetical protein